MKYVKSLGKKVVLNPAPIYDIPEDMYSYIDIIVLNEHEAAYLAGCDVDLSSAGKAVEVLLGKGLSQVVITLGKDGSVYNDGENIKHTPARKVKAVDTTAAGDTASGGLAVGLSKGQSIEEAIKFGSLCASIACTKRGAQMSVPSIDEVNEYLKK
jgi:ribokinase